MTEQTLLFTEEGGSIGVGAHVCAMGESAAGVLRTLARTFAVGLRNGERCAYIGPERSVGELRRLLEGFGVDVADAEGRGALIFVSDRRPLLRGGAQFDPHHLLQAIKDLFGATLEAGYPGLRLSADVPWIARDVPGADRILEFEAMADEVVNVPGTPLLAICQYRLSDIEAEDSLRILERHPLTLIGERFLVNDRYAG